MESDRELEKIILYHGLLDDDELANFKELFAEIREKYVSREEAYQLAFDALFNCNSGITKFHDEALKEAFKKEEG